MTEPSSDSPVVSGPATSQDGAVGDGLAYSVVVPMLNEAENVGPLVAEIDQAMQALRLAQGRYEIVIVDDGSSDGTGDLVEDLKATYPALRLIRHKARCGQSAGIRSGALAAGGDWIVTLDGDGQNDPADIPALVAAARAAGDPVPALVGGLRKKRRDSLSKRLASRFANTLRQGLLRDGCQDSGCGLKLINREVLLQIPFFNALHRFTPALVKMQGHRTHFIAVNHRPRLRGSTKYNNLQRGLVGLFDLVGVVWLMRRSKVPPPPAPPRPEMTGPAPASGSKPTPQTNNED